MVLEVQHDVLLALHGDALSCVLKIRGKDMQRNGDCAVEFFGSDMEEEELYVLSVDQKKVEV
jgi:hypothetical protein